MNNSLEFLNLYKILEQAIINKYNLSKNESPINYIMNMRQYSAYKEELGYCKEVRNFLAHEPKIDKEFAIIPSDEMIELIKDLIGMVNIAPAINTVMKRIEDCYYRSENDFVINSLKKLSHKLYTHIPIIKNNKVIGVLSKDSIFNYLLDNDFEKIGEDIKFKDLEEYTRLDKDKYLFVKSNTTIDEVIVRIEEEVKKGNRTLYIFITIDGTRNSNVLGLITPIDLLGY